MDHAWSENKILTHLSAARQLYKAAKDPAVSFPPPRFLSIWISEICNLDCTYCYFSDSNHNPERTFINTNEIISWLKEMKDFGAEALEFSGGGEPTVHKNFIEIFSAAYDMGYALGLITHGCNPMALETLVKTAKYVRVGLDAATPETHMAIKRKDSPRFFQKAVENIKEMVRLRDLAASNGSAPSFTVGIKVVLNSINFHEYTDVVWLARELGVDYIQIKYEHSSDHPIENHKMDVAQNYYDGEAASNATARTKALGNLRHQRATTHCFMSPIHTVVSAKGELLQCCFFGDRPIGTIRQPIREVWGGPQHRKVMEETTVEECDKVDCRWHFFNRKMKEIIEDPLQQASFI